MSQIIHYVECRYADCHYADCHYAECRGATESHSLNVDISNSYSSGPSASFCGNWWPEPSSPTRKLTPSRWRPISTRVTAFPSLSTAPTRCQFHKHFMFVTYSRSEISLRIFNTTNSTAYFGRAISYTHKMFMKLTTGANRKCYLTFYSCNLWMFVISYSVCP